MAPPKTPPRKRVLALAQWDANHFHLIWKGKLRRGKPMLSHEGQPLRVLLDLTQHPRIHTRRTCDEPRCINEDHHRIYLAQDHKYGDLPPPDWRHPTKDLSIFDLMEIDELLQNPPTQEQLADYPPRIRAEVNRRLGR